MKNKLFLFTIFASILFIFAACGGEDTSTNNDNTTDETETTQSADVEETAEVYEPEEIKDTDVCEVCAMAVPNNEHATQMVLKNHRSLKFDDLGCLYKWVEQNGEDEIGKAFVRDFHTEEWLDINDATFVYHEEIPTPMAYGVISFKDASEAEAYVEEFGKGTIMTKNELDQHEWKMNKEMMMGHDHDHDHDDHDGHDHDDDEHNHDEHDHDEE